jgi:hypothetical protein
MCERFEIRAFHSVTYVGSLFRKRIEGSEVLPNAAVVRHQIEKAIDDRIEQGAPMANRSAVPTRSRETRNILTTPSEQL